MFKSPLHAHGQNRRSAPPAKPQAAEPVRLLTTHPPGDPRRGEVEAFIRDVYAQRFGAQVPSFAPVLVCLRDRDGILAAAGYRSAATGPLFLESYLHLPVEAVLAAAANVLTSRRTIVEVGHLSARRAGEGRHLMLLLAPHLAQQGFHWVTSTVTEELRHLLVRFGLTPLLLGVADPLALGGQASAWGSYYAHDPVVVGGYLPHAMRQVRLHLSRAATPSLAHAA